MPSIAATVCIAIFGAGACIGPVERAEYIQTQNWDALAEQCSLISEGGASDADFYGKYCKAGKVNVDAVKAAKR